MNSPFNTPTVKCVKPLVRNGVSFEDGQEYRTMYESHRNKMIYHINGVPMPDAIFSKHFRIVQTQSL